MERVNLIDGFNKKYVIPCFQREYSWEDEEIEELIRNISSIDDKTDYCLGIITINNKGNSYLLIDGQQRITTLYLLGIHCNLLQKEDEIKLSSEYEGLISKQNNLVNLLNDKEECISQSINDGMRCIKRNIPKDNIEDFTKKLKKVYYYLVEIDDNIDINHYFEVMNSRGVQLSRSDIIKSYLMNKLDNDDDKYRLNHLWYNYEKMDNSNNKFNSFKEISKKMKSEYKSINEILLTTKSNTKNKENKITSNDSDSSILNFEYFLLYIIRIYNNIDSEELRIIGEFNLNDLINEYETTFKDVKDSNKIIKYLDFMIKMKNIYDKYIVKYNNTNETWRLGIKNNNTLLIQSCLRVSFINRRLMHWIYMTMKYFYKNQDINNYNNIMRNYIRETYIEVFLKDAKKSNYKTGFSTPNIVLNYLDLLIKEEYDRNKSLLEISGIKQKEFKYKFRNSIEHFMPRHDKSGNENPAWVDDFGNLALLSYGTNTKMQNADPDEKAKHFEKDLSGYSLKLQIMSIIALNDKWNKENIERTRNEMIKLLENDLVK